MFHEEPWGVIWTLRTCVFSETGNPPAGLKKETKLEVVVCQEKWGGGVNLCSSLPFFCFTYIPPPSGFVLMLWNSQGLQLHPSTEVKEWYKNRATDNGRKREKWYWRTLRRHEKFSSNKNFNHDKILGFYAQGNGHILKNI